MSARERAIIYDGVEMHLRRDATIETRNRKPMRAGSPAPWELRLGDLRVLYDAQDVPEPLVAVVAVGRKLGNRLVIE